jgi:hypothetical protein
MKAVVFFTDPRFTREQQTAEVELQPTDRTCEGDPVWTFEYQGHTYDAAQLNTRKFGLIWLVLC